MHFYGNVLKKPTPNFTSITFKDKKKNILILVKDTFTLIADSKWINFISKNNQTVTLNHSPQNNDFYHEEQEQSELLTQSGQDASALDDNGNNVGILFNIKGSDNGGHIHSNISQISFNIKKEWSILNNINKKIISLLVFIPQLDIYYYPNKNFYSICDIVDNIIEIQLQNFINNEIRYLPNGTFFNTDYNQQNQILTINMKTSVDSNQSLDPFNI